MIKIISDPWGLRLIYLFYFGGLGFFFPYIGVYLKDQDFSGTEIGLVLMAGSILSIIFVPYFSKNRFVKHHLIYLLQFFLLFSGGMVLALMVNESRIIIAVVLSLFALSNSFIEPFIGTLFIRSTELNKDPGFGSIRNWGSVGWSFSAVIAGFIIAKTGYVAIFFLLFSNFLVTILLLFKFIKFSGDKTASGKTVKSFKGLLEILQHRELVVISIIFLIENIILGMTQRFEGIYLIQLGGSEALIGLMSSLTALLEIPLMILADKGRRKLSALSLLKLWIILRFSSALIVLLFPDPYIILSTSVLRAISFSILIVLQIEFARTYSDQENFPAVLALFQVSIFQFAGIISSPLAGILFDHIGPWSLYLIRACGSIIAFAVLIFFFRKKKVQIENDERISAQLSTTE